MGQVQRLLLAALCKPAGKVWAGDMGTPGQGTALLPLGEVTREARNPGATAGLWGDGVCSRGGWAAADRRSHGASFTSPLTRSGSTGTRSLLAPAAGSAEILAPAEHHKLQLLPRPVLFTPFPGAESQVGKMLGMPSWVISISPAGSQNVFLGCPLSLPPLSHGAGVPQELDRDREVSSSVCNGVPGTGSQSKGTSREAGTASALAASRRPQRGAGHAHQPRIIAHLPLCGGSG